MAGLDRAWVCIALGLGLLCGCTSDTVPLEDGTSSGSGGSDATTAPGMTAPATSVTVADSDSTADTTVTDSATVGTSSSGTDTSVDDSSGSGTSSTGEPPVVMCDGDSCAVDMVFVIDNSGTIGAEQATLARAMVPLEARMRAIGLDAQIMFTTTDFGNPLCTPFEPEGYEPARGEPIATACTDRLQDFTSLTGATTIPEVCTDTCPNDVAPTDDPFVAFSAEGDNLPDVGDVDIDGDGQADPAAAQALACLAPMGINGCGYESPLENALQALNPAAAWNTGDRPLLRDEAGIVAIAILTDELDCSVQDYSVMDDPAFQSINPDNGSPQASSAICFNAGVECGTPNAMGVYEDGCTAIDGPLHEITRYTDYLINDLREGQGKSVIMLGMVGIPTVTEHAAEAPFTPTAGGIADLVYRNWINGEYPLGDILPDEFAQGVTAADKQFAFGIGPGCTGEDGLGGFTGQGIAPARLREVCEALNLSDALEDQRCCLESVCDADYAPAMGCLAGMIESVAAR